MDATTFAALGEPSRLQVVDLLRLRPFSVGDIVERLGIRQPQVSRHLGVLREARSSTPCPLADDGSTTCGSEPFEEIGNWVDSSEEPWEARLDSLEAFLAR